MMKTDGVKVQLDNEQISRELASEIDNILDAIHDDLLIADGKGIVLRVSPTFEQVYGLEKEDAIGMSVFDLEQLGYFKPSSTAIVLKSGEKVTMRQKNNRNRDIVVSATPVKAENGDIKFVISYSRDVTDLLHLQEQYAVLENKVEKYEEELGKLRSETLEVDGIVAKSHAMQNVLGVINRISPFDANVLIYGESGVGKSLLAKIIHKKSKRFEGPFIEINCGAIPENLLESELFGYERGSFTGANKEGKVGLIELAQNGTLFLDEISELPINLQVKVLKVIQDKLITRVGGMKEIKVDFRLVVASNKDLKQLMKEKLFRNDLYYRLNVISIDIPPLRARKEDIVPMIGYFTEKLNKKYGMKKIISKEVFDLLLKYEWPGNIRELENVIERLLLTSEDNLVQLDSLPDHINTRTLLSDGDELTRPLNETLELIEKAIITKAYTECGTTIGVAELLGISQPTAVRKIQKYISKTSPQ
ncbi:sigma-54 interaction domain-containing protein [Clostridium aminobutyricum]|uniref:Sigma 54-interacting transcriptional regulator n=1 Tax=Clostridium aminobutyricum TaxID=33953 RepID=A0A939D8R0_CLOAM|nr:sigma 54-interacting transcriptional regulator [Clostridium aminobutyricum]MBN7773190.1 sigma 54-interacting transcriptional regulator [Clostridium aminobutyricum]